MSETENTDTLERQSITVAFLGKDYEFERPVIAMRRKFQKDCLRIAAIYADMEFEDGSSWADGNEAKIKEHPKNMSLFMDCAELMLEIFVRYCPAIREDEANIQEAFNSGDLSDTEVGTEFGKLHEFVQAPSGGSNVAATAKSKGHSKKGTASKPSG